MDRHVNIMQNIPAGTRITETDMLKFDGMTGVPLHNKCRRHLSFHSSRFVHKRDQIVNEERSLVNGSGRCDQSADAGSNGCNGACIKGVIANHDLSGKYLSGYQNIKYQVGNAGNDTNGNMPCALAENQPAQTFIICCKRLRKSADERIRQIVHAHLFDQILIHQQVGEIIHLPALLGTPSHIAEVLSSVNEVDDCRRYGNRYDHQRCPGKPRCCEKDYQIAHKLNDRTDCTKSLRQDGQRAISCLSACIFHSLIKCRVIKGCHVQFLRFFHHLPFDLINNLFTCDPVHGTADIRDHLKQDAVDEQENQQPEHT